MLPAPAADRFARYPASWYLLGPSGRSPRNEADVAERDRRDQQERPSHRLVRGEPVDPGRAHRLRVRNLNVIDIPAIPDRFENRVIEPEHHDVLHRFFAQIMIDAVDLALL